MFVTKLRGKKPDPKNFTNIIAKEYYNSYLEKKNTKTVKRSKTIPSATESYRTAKHCGHKISYYRFFRNFINYLRL